MRTSLLSLAALAALATAGCPSPNPYARCGSDPESCRPVIHSVSPAEGPLAGGTTLTVLGNFPLAAEDDALEVRIAEVVATITAQESGQLTVTVPPGPQVGTYEIRALNRIGDATVPTEGANLFSYYFFKPASARGGELDVVAFTGGSPAVRLAATVGGTLLISRDGNPWVRSFSSARVESIAERLLGAPRRGPLRRGLCERQRRTAVEIDRRRGELQRAHPRARPSHRGDCAGA